ncbi:MAG: phage capsid protein [Proteobacteria bacterium]|nr:MAG: phage capsid protein [Pseudomonadota bacterium]
MPAPFPVDPHLTGISIAYKNADYIADAVLPRVYVGKESFKYWLYNLGEGFTIPNTRVGRKSEPNQVEFSATEATASTDDYALDDLIPQSDIDNAPANHDPKARAVQGITDLVMLDREVRTAGLVFAAANYNAANKATLAGNDQWSDFVNSDPVEDIETALNACLARPNIAVFGQETWSVLRRHPTIIKAVNRSSGDKGLASRQDVAELFELEEILVGQGRLNTAKKGQAVTLSRVWGKHAAFLYRNRLADTQQGLTFGFTAQFGDRVAGEIAAPTKGMRGGTIVRAGESVKELIVADRAGYLFTNAVA